MPLTTGSMRRNPNYALLYLYHYIVPGLRRCIYVICMVSASCPRHESAVKPVNPFLRPGQAISKRTSCLFFSPLSPTPSSICMCRGVSPVPTPSSSDLVASAPNSAGGSFPGPPGKLRRPRLIHNPCTRFFFLFSKAMAHCPPNSSASLLRIPSPLPSYEQECDPQNEEAA